MSTLEEIITAIELFFGFLSLFFVYYFMMFIGWLKSSWETILTQITEISIIVIAGLLLAAVFYLLRKWINTHSASQKTSVSKKAVPGTFVKGKNYGSRFLAIFLLMESIYTGFMTYHWLQLINSMAAGNFSEDLIGAKLDLLIFTPLVLQVVFVLHGAFSLFAQKSIAVVSLSLALIVSLLGAGYQFNSGIQHIGGALIYITVVRVLPLAYTIFLLRKGKLS